jgi:L-Lysine epsilon oxidase N-terminal
LELPPFSWRSSAIKQDYKAKPIVIFKVSPPSLPSATYNMATTELASHKGVDPTKIDLIRIYPPIGIARVGNSKDGWYIGPEVPGRFDEPVGGFKDAQGAVKRQVSVAHRVHLHRLHRSLIVTT